MKQYLIQEAYDAPIYVAHVVNHQDRDEENKIIAEYREVTIWGPFYSADEARHLLGEDYEHVRKMTAKTAKKNLQVNFEI